MIAQEKLTTWLFFDFQISMNVKEGFKTAQQMTLLLQSVST